MKTILSATFFSLMLLLMDATTSDATGTIQISYLVTFPEAQAHYADIEMHISGLKQNMLDLKMPVWTPGSYLVREFSKNVESFNVTTKGKLLPSPKIRKNCWR